MVVIAGLIGGGGLGAVVNSGLFSNPALAILAGFVIVIMAMALDRSTEAIAERTDPAKRHLDAAARRALRVQSGIVVVAVAPSPSWSRRRSARSGIYPLEAGEPLRSVTLQPWILTQLQSLLDYVQNPDNWVFKITEPTSTFILQKLLLPAPGIPHGGPVVRDAARARRDRVRGLRASARRSRRS